MAVADGDEAAFLADLPITRLWGVGRVGAQGFHKLGIRTIGQLQALPRNFLAQHFGNGAEHLWRLARGLEMYDH